MAIRKAQDGKAYPTIILLIAHVYHMGLTFPVGNLARRHTVTFGLTRLHFTNEPDLLHAMYKVSSGKYLARRNMTVK
jgi:hypothetical protein